MKGGDDLRYRGYNFSICETQRKDQRVNGGVLAGETRGRFNLFRLATMVIITWTKGKLGYRGNQPPESINEE